jgi:hypothetical protein
MEDNNTLNYLINNDNNYHFDNYINPNNIISINHNKDQIKDLNYKYINTTEPQDLQDNNQNFNNSSSNIDPKMQSGNILKSNYESYYLNNHIPKIIVPNIYLKNSIKSNNYNNPFSSGANLNYDPYPAYSSKTNLSYNTYNSIEKENSHNNLNSYLNSNHNNNINNSYANFNANINNNHNNLISNLENSTNSNNLNSNLDKLLENLQNHSQELEGKNCENNKLREQNCMLYDTINNLEATSFGLREENEYKQVYLLNQIFFKFKNKKLFLLEDFAEKSKNFNIPIENGKKQ